MAAEVVRADIYAKFLDEIRALKEENLALKKTNDELLQRLHGLHGEYQELRYHIKGMASHGEVLMLRKKILELQNQLQLKRSH
jgi:predicted RNase H-like nuclease (RuvC/YqgF family)